MKTEVKRYIRNNNGEFIGEYTPNFNADRIIYDLDSDSFIDDIHKLCYEDENFLDNLLDDFEEGFNGVFKNNNGDFYEKLSNSRFFICRNIKNVKYY
jgi:hypothetical protein|nr:MAG TPA: hypothetical protein [Caudoviricetes sp.]